MFGSWVGEGFARTALDGQVLLSLKLSCISTAEGLMITNWRDRPSPSQRVNKSSVYLAFLLVENLRTLSLINCLNLPFLLALNPEKNPQKAILCPKLEELVIHVEIENWFYINEVLEMAKERASKGIKLETIRIVSSEAFVPAKEVLKLRNHVSRVEYRLDDIMPRWDETPMDPEDVGYDSDW